MTTVTTPVLEERERLDDEIREAYVALDTVLFWQFTSMEKKPTIAVRELIRNQLVHLPKGHPKGFHWEFSGSIDAARRVDERMRAYREVRSIVRRIAAEPAWRDNPLVQDLLEQTLELQERLEQDEDGTDPQWMVKETVDSISDLISRLLREQDHDALDEPPMAAQYALAQLKGIEQEELAELFAVDARTIRDWKSGKTKTIRKNPERVILIAQLIYDLRRAMTSRGIVRWFKRSRPQLEGRTPLELIDTDTDTAAEALRPLARGVRGQLGT